MDTDGGSTVEPEDTNAASTKITCKHKLSATSMWFSNGLLHGQTRIETAKQSWSVKIIKHTVAPFCSGGITIGNRASSKFLAMSNPTNQ